MNETLDRSTVAKPRKSKSKLTVAEQEIKAMKAYAKKISSSKDDALDFLVRAGIATKNGQLAKPYRS